MISKRPLWLAHCVASLTPFSALLLSVNGATLTFNSNAAGTPPWSDPQNWVGNVAPVAGDSLILGNGTALTALNDFPAGTQFNGITFSHKAQPIAIIGNPISLNGDIVNNNTTSQLFNSPTTLGLSIALLQSSTFNAGNGILSFNDTISGLSGTPTLTLTGTATSNSFISGTIADGTASHLALSLTGATTWTLSGANTYTGNTTLNSAALKLAPTTPLTFSSNLSGPGGLILAPDNLTASITLAGNNSAHTGNISILPGNAAANPGPIIIPSNAAFGSGTLSLNGSGQSNFPTLQFTNGPRTLSNPVSLLGSNTQPTITGTDDVTFTGHILAVGSTTFIRNNLDTGATLFLNGPLYLSNTGGARTFAIRGTGLTVINGNIENAIVTAIQDCTFSPSLVGVTIINSTSLNYTGNTLVSGGTTVFNVPGVLPPARNLQNTADVKISLASTSAAVAYAGGIMDPAFLSRLSGVAGAIAILSAADAATNVDFSAPTATAASPSWASLSLGAAMGSFTYSGTLTPRDQDWRLGGGNGTLTFTQAITDRNALPTNLSISGRSGALILTSTNNTYTGSTTLQNEANLISGVTNALSPVTNVTFSNARSVFDLAGFDQTLAGITGTGVITSSAGAPVFTTNLATNSTFSGTLSGSLNLLKSGPATLTLAGPLAYTGATTIQSGTLVLNGTSNALHTITGSGLLQLAPNRTLTADTLTLAALQLDIGAVLTLRPNQPTPSQLAALTLAADTNNTFTARLELADNPLILQTNTTNKSTYLSTIQTAVTQGAAGLVGITSTTTAADPTHKTTVAIDNALLHLTTFFGQNVDDNSLLIASTWLGDSNLDRKVNVTDLGTLATYYGQPVPNGILQGDFNQDGLVNVTDLGLLATNYGQGTAPGTTFSLNADQLPFTNYQLLSTPEPTSLALLSLALLPYAHHRRRRTDR